MRGQAEMHKAGRKMRLRKGWLKDQMDKVAKEVEEWPEWMKKLEQAEYLIFKKEGDGVEDPLREGFEYTRETKKEVKAKVFKIFEKKREGK